MGMCRSNYRRIAVVSQPMIYLHFAQGMWAGMIFDGTAI